MTTEIFQYQDYRLYLKAVLQERQQRLSDYSLARFAKALGFSSHSGLAMILSGKRELKSPYFEKCAKNLGLGINERLYFEAMLRADQLTAGKRKQLLREVQFLSADWKPPEPEEGIKMLEYGLVHHILGQAKTFLSLPEIAKRFRYPVDRKNLQTILMLMLDHNQIVAVGDRFRLQTDMLVVQNEAPSLSARTFHRDALRFAEGALSDPLDQREFQTYLLTIDSKKVPEMKAEIRKFVQSFIAKFESDLDADTAIQFHTHFFESIAPKKTESL